MSLQLTKNPTPLTVQQITFEFSWRVEQATKGKNKFFGKLAAAVGAGGVDLDLNVIAFNAAGNAVACAHPDDKVPFPNGCLEHQGDAKAGGRGDGRASEAIRVNLANMHSDVKYLVCAVTAFGNGVAFEKLAGAEFIIHDDAAGQPLTQSLRSIEGSPSAALLAKITRTDAGGWSVEALEESYTSASNWRDLARQASRVVSPY